MERSDSHMDNTVHTTADVKKVPVADKEMSPALEEFFAVLDELNKLSLFERKVAAKKLIEDL